VAQLELTLGHLDRAKSTAESVHRRAPHSSAIWQKALGVLVQHAHLCGEAQLEDALLLEWESVDPAVRLPEAAVRRARRDVRSGRPEAALAALAAELEHHGEPHPVIAIECARAACYAGRAGAAIGYLDALDERRVREEPALQAAADHARYMALHDLDLNRSAAGLSTLCVKRFGELGAIGDEVLCRINLGDALWGCGDGAAARAALVKARRLAEDCELPHALDVARLCLANVIACSDPDEALELYDAALGDAAQRGEWRWDAIYGRIYRSLLIAEQTHRGGATLRLHAEEARRHGYRHLEALALGFSVMADVVGGAVPDEPTLEHCLRSRYPGTVAYAAAAAIVAGPAAPDRDEASSALHAALASTEGIKGRPAFLLRAAGA
jgi:hypothetical protein